MKDIDPLTLAIAPPPSETPEQRLERLKNEQEAREISKRIDEEIRLEKVAFKKKKKPIKVLVLGQSESGKSTTIKNFQKMLAPQLWDSERASWRAVIFLNLVHSVNSILKVLAAEMAASRSTSTEFGSTNFVSGNSQMVFTSNHKLLKMRLGPLNQIQYDLEALLGTSSSRVPLTSSTDYGDPISAPKTAPLHRDFWVVTNHGWKSVLEKVRGTSDSHPNNSDNDGQSRRPRVARRGTMRTEDIVEVLAGCAADIKTLWSDSVVQKMLKNSELILEDWARFFLHDVDRIANRDYIPSDKDIMHARLQTMGVQEYRFQMGNEHIKNERPLMAREWAIYDVAGIRTSRAAWFPFFDDINTIIFLVPVSAFDQVLAEDETVNRVADSVSLWTMVCASKILEGVQLILLLNKCDVLKRKLEDGKKVGDWVKSFAGKNNDYESVLKHYRHMFKHILLDHSPKRAFYSHFTSVVETKTTAKTLAMVQEAIVEHLLADADFI